MNKRTVSLYSWGDAYGGPHSEGHLSEGLWIDQLTFQFPAFMMTSWLVEKGRCSQYNTVKVPSSSDNRPPNLQFSANILIWLCVSGYVGIRISYLRKKYCFWLSNCSWIKFHNLALGEYLWNISFWAWHQKREKKKLPGNEWSSFDVFLSRWDEITHRMAPIFSSFPQYFI